MPGSYGVCLLRARFERRKRAEALCRQQPFPRDAAVFAATAVAEALQSLVGHLPIHGQLPAANA